MHGLGDSLHIYGTSISFINYNYCSRTAVVCNSRLCTCRLIYSYIACLRNSKHALLLLLFCMHKTVLEGVGVAREKNRGLKNFGGLVCHAFGV